MDDDDQMLLLYTVWFGARVVQRSSLANISVFGIWWIVRKSSLKKWIFQCLANIEVFGIWCMVRKSCLKKWIFLYLASM